MRRDREGDDLFLSRRRCRRKWDRLQPCFSSLFFTKRPFGRTASSAAFFPSLRKRGGQTLLSPTVGAEGQLSAHFFSFFPSFVRDYSQGRTDLSKYVGDEGQILPLSCTLFFCIICPLPFFPRRQKNDFPRTSARRFPPLLVLLVHPDGPSLPLLSLLTPSVF